VADSFVRHSHVPVLLLHPSGSSAAPQPIAPHPLRKICITLDGSPLAEQILTPALALGAGNAAEYTLLHVVDALVLVSTSFTPDLLQHQAKIIAGLQQEAQQYLETLAGPLRAEGHHITTRVLVDPEPAQAILRAARDDGSDIIALATHGRGGVQRLLVGSVADKVLRSADRPVLVYRPQVAPQPEVEAKIAHDVGV
ncbi:MAG TPA: universal stress protein, partial [Herpetosiphonaceae bacterium]